MIGLRKRHSVYQSNVSTTQQSRKSTYTQYMPSFVHFCLGLSRLYLKIDHNTSQKRSKWYQHATTIPPTSPQDPLMEPTGAHRSEHIDFADHFRPHVGAPWSHWLVSFRVKNAVWILSEFCIALLSISGSFLGGPTLTDMVITDVNAYPLF